MTEDQDKVTLPMNSERNNRNITIIGEIDDRISLMNREQEHLPIESAVVLCMDEANRVAPETVMFGVAGSGVTHIDEDNPGKPEVFPLEDRRALEEIRDHMYGGLGSIASKFGVPLGITSHPGCGATGAQGIPAEKVPSETEKLADEVGVPYYGHLPVSDEPQPLDGNAEVKASIVRAPEDHHHTATHIAITVGGGITGKEKQNEMSDGKDFFKISADWVSHALKSGANRDDIKAFLKRQILVGRAIAPGVRENSDPYFVFDAGRLPEESHENLQLVKEVLEDLKDLSS